MEKLKAGVIGCGGAAQIDHIRWYAQHPEVELVGLADTDFDRAKFCAQRWGGRPYRDAVEMLDQERPDIVSVCSPVAQHPEHTIAALERGCHVLCEKPMAPTLEQCDQMIATAERKNVILAIAFHKRHNVGLVELRRRLRGGDIGEPIFLRTHWTMFPEPSKGFRGRLETGGGCFQDHGSHYIDQYRWWIGEIDSVQGSLLIQWPEEMEVEDHGVALLQFKDGPQGMIETSWVGPGYDHGQLEDTYVYGTEGALFISVPPWTHYEPPELRLWQRKNNQWITIPLSRDMLFFEHYHYKRQIDDFVKAVRERRKPAAIGEDGRKAIEVVLALYLSHHTGRRVQLPLTQTPPLEEIFADLRCRSK